MKNSNELADLNGITIRITSKDEYTDASEELLTAQDIDGIVINEILADPTGGPSGGFDTDGDGTVESGDDEFIEIYNNGTSTIDIGGWTISDDDGAGHTIPAGTMLAPGDYYTINGTDAGFPALGNSGDEVILSDGTSSISASYGSDSDGEDFGFSSDGLSMSRFPDGGMMVSNENPTPDAMNECFLTGTRILTTEGYKKVEDLSTSDHVLTADHKEIPIKWIGVQTMELDKTTAYPVCIRENALAEGIPSSDLYVSPDHALLVDELLINAGALLNGKTIFATEPKEDFKYFHVELDKHAMLVAEGAPAESYLPQKEDRDAYDNGQERADDANILLIPMDYPRISASYKVPSDIKEKLNKRAGILKTA